MFGEITIASRPLRLAFLIPPDTRSLRKAIQINSSLWGGLFNPILPLYARLPRGWREIPGKLNSPRERVLGYIRAFDPDFLVGCGVSSLPSYITTLKVPVVSADQIWRDAGTSRFTGTPNYGVGIFEVLRGAYEEFFERPHRLPHRVLLPRSARNHDLFWEAALGRIPSSLTKIIEDGYARGIDIEKPEPSAQTYSSLTANGMLFPCRLARFGLKLRRGARDAFGFLMDADNFIDIVDFWNLRALGRPTLPIPKQFVAVPEFQALVSSYIAGNYRVSAHNPDIDYGTSIIRSASSTMDELTAFAKALPREQKESSKFSRRILLQHWYPRIWDEWAIGKDAARPDVIVGETREVSVDHSDGAVRLETLLPRFADTAPSTTPRLANDIAPRLYGQGEENLANVLPFDYGDHVLRELGTFAGLRNFRVGRNGLIHLVSWTRGVQWELPKSEAVFLAWLNDHGIRARLSACGRLSKEMYTQLRGWLHVLCNEPLVQFLEKITKPDVHTGESKGMPLGGVKGALKNLGTNLYAALTERGVFQLGFETRCTHCQRQSWHNPKEFASELVCPLCHKTIDMITAVDRENGGHWHLRTAGAFSVGKFGDGAYCVLLTKKLLEKDSLGSSSTSVFSFEAAQAGSKDFEADYGLMWRQQIHGNTEEGVLFAECKSYDEFGPRDFRRMSALGAKFPGAVLAFCTLRKELKPSERRTLLAMCRKGMKQWKTERPLNPILILTGQELFDPHGPPHCWKGMDVPKWVDRAYSILSLCNATQAIYLGQPDWQTTWHEKFEARQQKRAGQ